LFTKDVVVLGRSRRVVLQKYETRNETYREPEVRNLLGEFQVPILLVGQVRVGPRATGHRCTSVEFGTRAKSSINGGIFLKGEEINNGRDAETDA
jgi:hypothetical protein